MEKEATGVPKGPPKPKCCDLILEWTCRDRQGALGAGGLKRTKVFMEREQFGMKASMGSGRGKAANTKPHSTHSSEPLLCYFHPKTGNCLNRTLNRSSFHQSLKCWDYRLYHNVWHKQILLKKHEQTTATNSQVEPLQHFGREHCCKHVLCWPSWKVPQSASCGSQQSDRPHPSWSRGPGGRSVGSGKARFLLQPTPPPAPSRKRTV
jgi:hypothetical protein